MEAAFKPEVKDELDTRNFEKFEEVDTPTLPLRKYQYFNFAIVENLFFS
jgi:hypothetical protein